MMVGAWGGHSSLIHRGTPSQYTIQQKPIPHKITKSMNANTKTSISAITL
jgi:hypothetical protein